MNSLSLARGGRSRGARRLPTVQISAAGSCASATSLPQSACRLASIAIDAQPGVTGGLADPIEATDCDVKVTDPAATLSGTVVFLTGGDGQSWWEVQNAAAVSGVMTPARNRGQRIVQLNWNSGGWDRGTEGPFALAARSAAVLRAIYEDPRLHSKGTPFCVVGHSSGASQVCYSMCHYGADQFIDCAVLLCGPPHARIDWGCHGSDIGAWAEIGPSLCTTGNTIAYDATAQALIHNAYQGTTCCSSKQMVGGVDDRGPRDSILRWDALLSWPNTDVTFIFGDADNTAATPLGRYFARQLQTDAVERITTGGATHNGVQTNASSMTYQDEALAAAQFRH